MQIYVKHSRAYTLDWHDDAVQYRYMCHTSVACEESMTKTSCHFYLTSCLTLSGNAFKVADGQKHSSEPQDIRQQVWNHLSLHNTVRPHYCVLQFNKRIAKHLFCSICGICSYYIPRSNPDGVAVTVTCLDEYATLDVQVQSCDGQNWEQNVGESLRDMSKPALWKSEYCLHSWWHSPGLTLLFKIADLSSSQQASQS